MLKFFVLLSFITLYTFSCQGKTLSKEDIVYAIDIGSHDDFTGNSGIDFKKDDYYDSHTKLADYKYDQAVQSKRIKYTSDTTVYMTERHADSSFKYYLPIPEPGTYVLILKFCEMYFQIPGKRIFNLKLGDKVVVQDLDIVAKVGPYAAYDEYIEFEVRRDNTVYHKNEKCPNAYKENTKKLTVEFQKTKFDNPKVDGLILVKGGIEDTDQTEYLRNIAEWDDKMQEEERLNILDKKKLYESRKKLQDDFDSSLDYSGQITFWQSIREILFTTTYGYTIIGAVILYFVLISLTDDQKQESEDVDETKTNQKKDESQEIQQNQDKPAKDVKNKEGKKKKEKQKEDEKKKDE